MLSSCLETRPKDEELNVKWWRCKNSEFITPPDMKINLWNGNMLFVDECIKFVQFDCVWPEWLSSQSGRGRHPRTSRRGQWRSDARARQGKPPLLVSRSPLPPSESWMKHYIKAWRLALKIFNIFDFCYRTENVLILLTRWERILFFMSTALPPYWTWSGHIRQVAR